jgi:ABC-type lipoprotein export system ATPase subunit
MLIECQDLSKNYIADNQQVVAVQETNLQVATGDFITILGHSGSGKTTLLSLIGGLTKPDSGNIIINGSDAWTQNDKEGSFIRNQTIGFVFQFASLIPTLTAIENLLLPLSFSKKSGPGKERAEMLLEQVGLIDKRNNFPAQLSGGQQRRIAIARAFMNSPQIILADEPTGDLDEQTEEEIMQFFNQQRQQGVTFLIVTHNSQLTKGCDGVRIFHMKNGVLAEQ